MHKTLTRLLITISSVLFSLPSLALSVGEITLDSALGQPLSAQLSLSELGGLEAEQIIVRHAERSTYDKLNVEHPTVFQAIRFNVNTTGDRGSIHLTTRDAVNEPYLRLLVHIRWPQGEMLKEVTLLLDPT